MKIRLPSRKNQSKRNGLPDDSTLEIVHIEPFPSKRLAMKFESTMKQALKDYRVDNEIAKAIFRESGHTECFILDSLNLIARLLSEPSGEPSGEPSTE